MDMSVIMETTNPQTGSGTVVYKTKTKKEPFVVFSVEFGKKEKLSVHTSLAAAIAFAEGFEAGRTRINGTSVVFMACSKCWGKGYSTQRVGDTGGSGDFSSREVILRHGGTRIRLCDCDRGKDINSFFGIKEEYQP